MTDATPILTNQDILDYISVTDHASYAKKNALLLAGLFNQLQTRIPVSIGIQGDSVVAGFDNVSSDVIPSVNGDGFTIAPVQWPLALQNRLREFTGVLHTVSNYGYSGDTAKSGYERWTAKPSVSLMHVCYGINDSGGRSTFPEYMQYMEMTIRRLLDWGIAVVIHTVTPVAFNVENIASEYFSESLRGLCAEYGVPVFDSETTIIYAKYEGVYCDGKHLNAHGYNKYGTAVSSFIIAGGWVGGIKRLTGETLVSPGQGADGIGFVDSTNIQNSGSSSGSAVLNRSTGRMTMVGQRKTFSFFMDCEYANVSAIGAFDGLKISLCEPLSPSSDSDIRCNQALNKTIIKSSTAKNIIETPPYQVYQGRSQADAGELSYIGCLVGRGWKTVSFTALDLSANPAIQLISISPCTFNELSRNQTSAVPMGSNVGIKPVKEHSYALQVPWVGSSAPSSSSPAAASIPSSIYFPIPDGVSPYQSPNSVFTDGLPMELTITSTNGWGKFIIFRTSSSAGGFYIGKIAGNLDSIQPLSITFAYAPYDETTGYCASPVDGFRVNQSDSGLIRINFGTTPASFYNVILSCNSKVAAASVGV